jgi:hypothetical protein
MEELVPGDAWDFLEVGRLQRAAQDSSYREDVLRAKGIVSGLLLPVLLGLPVCDPCWQVCRELEAVLYRRMKPQCGSSSSARIQEQQSRNSHSASSFDGVSAFLCIYVLTFAVARSCLLSLRRRRSARLVSLLNADSAHEGDFFVPVQFPEFVLDRLGAQGRLALADRRLRALAFLGPLIQLYTGRHQLRTDAHQGGIKQLSVRTNIQAGSQPFLVSRNSSVNAKTEMSKTQLARP